MTTASTPGGFGMSLDHWFGDPAHAAALALAYLNPDRYSGALWDPATARRRIGGAAFAIDVEDLYAPTLLSAPIDRAAGQGIVRRSAVISELLRGMPVELKLWDPGSGDLTEGLRKADDLIRELDKVPNIGWTKASKLVAAKRPNLIPIWDEQVAAALIVPPKMTWLAYWNAWADALNTNAALGQIEDVASTAGHDELSPLRVADIVIWMAQHGFKSLPDDHSDLRARCANDLVTT